MLDNDMVLREKMDKVVMLLSEMRFILPEEISVMVALQGIFLSIHAFACVMRDREIEMITASPVEH